ncbi:uncharacterized protein LOC100377915 [Saccoglossus kowalevskii]|uniref:Cyclic nucleotide-binding domain-containing protein 2-like n=1 Tax=Saccoglossus kowalevskii TaxID=10224 RepID=A0ABM0M3X7_SACKO|nr:PREDICTED: cyclic nucleotide-binding domain-containing protein 2-like [Saccoglossus kowalevskii]
MSGDKKRRGGKQTNQPASATPKDYRNDHCEDEPPRSQRRRQSKGSAYHILPASHQLSARTRVDRSTLRRATLTPNLPGIGTPRVKIMSDVAKQKGSAVVFQDTGSPKQSVVTITANKPQRPSEGGGNDIFKQMRIEAAKKARERFQHAIRLILTLIRVFNMIQSRAEKEAHSKAQMTFTEIAEQFQSDEMKNSGLSFNPNDFKAKREINISSEVKNILSLPSEQRSPEQLLTALYGLQTMKSFAEYPLHMQEKLTRVAWFENIPPRKVIIRQGHYAEAFYFIISGSAVVTIMETNPVTGEAKLRTATVLRKGSSFGELALLHHSVRTATVSSQGHVQLLAIGREDFFDIFMRGQRPGEEPEHITFLRQVECLKDFPFEKLMEHPERCLFHFYKRGQIIVKDSNSSEWLYVVKSGTCQVLKQLKAVKPGEYHAHRGVKLPRIDDSGGGVSRARHSERQRALSMSPRNQKDSMLSELEEARDELRPLPNLFLTRTRTADSIQEVNRLTSPSSSSSSSSTPSPTSPVSEFDIRKGAVLIKKSVSKSKYRNFTSAKKSRVKIDEANNPSPYSRNKENYLTPRPKDKKDKSVFVQLELLYPKHVFGLNTLIFDEDLIAVQQTSVHLISRGAECIMLHKSFFTKHADDKVRRAVRQSHRPYPTTETLQDHLQDFTNWNHFKKEAVHTIVWGKS